MDISVKWPWLDLKEDKKKAKESDDDKDIPAKLAKSIIIDEKLPDLPH